MDRLQVSPNMSPREAHPAVEAVLYFRMHSVFFSPLFLQCVLFLPEDVHTFQIALIF